MPSKTKSTPHLQVDQLGLPPGAMFNAEQVSDLLNVSLRQLKRWRLADPPVLKAMRPAGARSGAYYTRAELIRFLTK